ncbi:MAG: 50S ribosomal protein L11 methyltransferase [Bdellovibrionales bacterium]
MNPYFRVRFLNLSVIHEDVLTTLSIDHGATGVSEALEFTQPDLTFDPRITKRRAHDIDVYFLERPSETFFEEVRRLDPNIRWQIFEEQHKDWLEEWKKGFVPFPLTPKVWVVPSWLEKPAEAPEQIRIDPGMAFGTGTHATTKMAAHLIAKFVEKNQKTSVDLNLLDVGTGTAILAILARIYGIGRVKGIDIDAEARRVSRDNVKLNQATEIEITDQLLEDVREKFDLVMANIIDGVLLQLQADLLRVLKPGGHLFVTGVLLERESLFFEKFIEAQKLRVVRRLEKDEWVGFWLQREADR